MKNSKKFLAGCITAAILLTSITLPVSAAGWDWPTSYDMSSSQFPVSQIANRQDGVNYGFFEDPDDPTNTVIGTLSSPDGTGNADMRAVMNYTTKAVQFDFDIYRVNISATFEVRLYANTGGASGNDYVNLLTMDSNGNVVFGGTSKAKYEAGKWYNMRIKTNMAKRYHEIYMKAADEEVYNLIGSLSNADLGFNSDVYMHYFFRNNSTSFTYLDNMTWVELSGDLGIKVRYDFNDVVRTTGKYWPSLNINADNMTYEQATFDGEQVLKSIQNETGAREARTWEDVPDMDRVVVSSRAGINSEGNEIANLPRQVGIRPNFAQPDGTKSVDARNNLAEGIRLEYSRYINMEGTTIMKNASDGLTKEGYHLIDGKLYDIGYVYDRINKIFKAYFITQYGETVVIDKSALSYVQEQRYLAGVSLYSRADATYKTGKGYYDYLYIDEAESFAVQSTTPANNASDVSFLPEIKIEFNYVIDPSDYGTAVLQDAQGETVNATVSTYNGKTLVVKPDEKLSSLNTYTLTVSGAKDLLGQTAEDVTMSFTTGSPLYVSDVVVNNGGPLIDGDNAIAFSLASNDGDEYEVTLIAALFDLTTRRMLDIKAIDAIVPATGDPIPLNLNYDTTGFSNYKMELYVWSGLGTMRPYAPKLELTK